MNCPYCEKRINLGEQVIEWDKLFGDEAMLVAEFPIMINIMCEYCDKSVAMMFIEAVEGEEIVKSPLGDVHIPKIKKDN